MTDRERDAPRSNPDEDADDRPTLPVGPEDVEGAEEELPIDDGYEDGEDGEDGDEESSDTEVGAEADEETGEPNVATAAAAGPRAGARLRLGQRLGRADATTTTAPLVTPSERAVRIDDRASQVYVLGVVATFVGILLFGMLWGTGGFFTTPPASPSPSPSASAGASASPSISLQPSAASPSGAGTSSAPAASASPSPAGS
jgi:hypothetical protein